jgi:hypothetical protein
MDEIQRKTNLTLGLAFLVWPFLVLTESIRNYRESWAMNGVWLFSIFFGFTFVPREGNDSMRYILSFQEMYHSDMGFTQIFGMLYSYGSGVLDIIQPLIALLVSRFTQDYRVLFAIYGAIFGFFYSRNIWTLIRQSEGKLSAIEKVLLIPFALVIPLWFVNGVRFWTAAHIFIYGALQVLLFNRKQGFLIASISLLMHFSFILPLGILGTYMLIGNRTNVYFILFVISLFFSEINPLVLRDILLNILPEFLHSRVYDYTNEDLLELIRQVTSMDNWYVSWHNEAIKIGIVALMIGIYFTGRTFWKEKKVLSLFSFSLLFGAIANVLGSISSLGRFVTVFYMFSIAGIFMFYLNASMKHATRKLFYLVTPLFMLFFVVAMRIGFDNTGLFAVISNPVFAPLHLSDFALIDLIK